MKAFREAFTRIVSLKYCYEAALYPNNWKEAFFFTRFKISSHLAALFANVTILLEQEASLSCSYQYRWLGYYHVALISFLFILCYTISSSLYSSNFRLIRGEDGGRLVYLANTGFKLGLSWVSKRKPSARVRDRFFPPSIVALSLQDRRGLG